MIPVVFFAICYIILYLIVPHFLAASSKALRERINHLFWYSPYKMYERIRCNGNQPNWIIHFPHYWSWKWTDLIAVPHIRVITQQIKSYWDGEKNNNNLFWIRRDLWRINWRYYVWVMQLFTRILLFVPYGTIDISIVLIWHVLNDYFCVNKIMFSINYD